MAEERDRFAMFLVVLVLVAMLGVSLVVLANAQLAKGSHLDKSPSDSADVCINVLPYQIPAKSGGWHTVTRECRLAEYWSVAAREFVAKKEHKAVYYLDSISRGKVYVTYADSVPVSRCHFCKGR